MRVSTKKLLLIGLLGLISSFSFSQKPAHQYSFNGQVKWMLLTDTGTLLASTGEALVGIKPNSPNVSFKIDRLKKVKKEDLQFIPGTPYVVIKPKGNMFIHTTVLDLVQGKLVFDSKAENWKNGVTSRYFLTPEMKFVVNGMHKEEGFGQYKLGVGLYDMLTGKLIRIFERKPANGMSGKPDILGNHIIIPGLKTIACYDISNGNEIWKANVKNATSIETNEATNEIYAFRTKGTNTVVYKVDASNGQLLWPEGNKLSGVISRVHFTKHGLAVVTNIVSSGQKGLLGKVANKMKGSGQSKVYLLDLNTGADLWKKSPKTKGIITHFYIEPDGILFGVASGGINKVAFNGTPLWKKPLKTGPGIQIMARVKKGVLYISQTDTDIINMKTGESVFGKPVKYKNSKSVTSTFDETHNQFLISCKNGVYAIDGNNGEYKLLSNSLKFEGKEAPNEISVRSNGILLSSDQNLTMINFEGKTDWHTYYKPPGISTVGKIFMGAMAISSLAMASAAGYQAGASKALLGPYHSNTKRLESYQEGFSNISTASFKELGKRFKATKATQNAAFILTKLSAGVGLVKVNKDTGKKMEEIILNDKKPVYEVDDIEGILYFKSKGNTISAYNLKS
ncbi:MAG: outer membrane protein assembly factor BamB family protein [Lutibacter sp.]